jgi:hypothetical protein
LKKLLKDLAWLAGLIVSMGAGTNIGVRVADPIGANEMNGLSDYLLHCLPAILLIVASAICIRMLRPRSFMFKEHVSVFFVGVIIGSTLACTLLPIIFSF